MEHGLVGALFGLIMGGTGIALLGWGTTPRVRVTKVVVQGGRADIVEAGADDSSTNGPYRRPAERGHQVPALLRMPRHGPSLRTLLGLALTMLGTAFLAAGIATATKPQPVEHRGDYYSCPTYPCGL